MTSAASASNEQSGTPSVSNPEKIPRETVPLPGDFCFALDHDAVIAGDGAMISGGAPPRLIRLTVAGGSILSAIAEGCSLAEIELRQRGASLLVRRLLDAGLVHPVPHEKSGEGSLQVVVPVRNRPEHLRGLLACLPTTIRVIVVDDASDDNSAAVGRAFGCAVLSLAQRRGPSGARNAGWRATDAAFVAFMDSDCRPEPGTLERLKAHFADASVGAAAPRIRTLLDSGSGIVQRYEACRSSEDLGPWPALVRPLSKVAYVPTVLLVVRRTALVEVGGFDEEMPLGEDVDLVWRLVAARWEVRYDPDVRAAHDHRRRLAKFLLRKIAYGSAAAALERRHPGWLAPPRLPLVNSVAWLVFVARPFWGLAALALVAIGYFVQSKSLVPVPSPSGALRRILANGTALADACVRTWLPASIAASLLVPRLGVLLVVGAIASGVLDWRRCKCRLDPFRFIAIRSLDDAAYSIGVWWGCLRHRSFAPLIPKFVGLRRRAAGTQPEAYA